MKAMLVVTTYGEFKAVVRDEYGNDNVVYASYNLEDCLRGAAVNICVPIELPITPFAQ